MTIILSKDEYMTECALAEMWGVKRNTLQNGVVPVLDQNF